MRTKVLAVALAIVVFLVLFGIPQHAKGDTAPWAKVPNFPAKWQRELGGVPGEIILSVEYQCGKEKPLYTLLKQCASPKRYSAMGWEKGESKTQGRTCDGRWMYTYDLSFWEHRGGPVPERPPAMCDGKKRPGRK